MRRELNRQRKRRAQSSVEGKVYLGGRHKWLKEDCDTDDNIEIPTNNTDVVNLAMIVLYCTIKKYTEDKYVQYGNILWIM